MADVNKAKAAVASIEEKWNALSGSPPDIQEELDEILDALKPTRAPAKPAAKKPTTKKK